MHTCACVPVCNCMHVCEYVYVPVYVCASACMCVCVHMRGHAASVGVCKCMHVSVCVCVSITMTKCLAEVLLVPIKGSSVIVVKNAWQGRVICRRGIMQMESRERQMGARSGGV